VRLLLSIPSPDLLIISQKYRYSVMNMQGESGQATVAVFEISFRKNMEKLYIELLERGVKGEGFIEIFNRFGHVAATGLPTFLQRG
jgi:hypothetical protein